MNVVSVSVFTSLNKTLFYQNYNNSSIGDLILIKVRNRNYYGVVLEIKEIDIDKLQKCKPIEKIILEKFFDPKFIKFATHFSNYNISHLGEVFSLSISQGIESAAKVLTENEEHLLANIQRKKLLINSDKTKITSELFKYNNQQFDKTLQLQELNIMQKDVFHNIQKNIDQHKTDLIYGITGSGKTEVFLHLADFIIKNDPTAQVLIMLPEVMLVENLIQKLKNRINVPFTIWHSGLHKKKTDIVDIVTGKSKIIFGTRSAMMLKYQNLKAIIIDEEHDDSYKQSEGIFYHARDMSILRGFYEKFPVFLFSATPSMESLYNVWQKKYNFYKLESRFFDSKLPKFNFSESPKQTLISETAKEVIKKNLEDELQTMFFINKRGYAKFLICTSCGKKEMCENCDFALCYHKSKNAMKCHHCNAIKKVEKSCKSCSSNMCLADLTGIESYNESLMLKHFTSKKPKITMISSDMITSKTKMQEVLDTLVKDKPDVIFGTKILSKGFHIPKLKSVIIVDENLKNEEDFRGDEKLMQIITQVSGRAGREMKDGGEIFIESDKIDQKMKNFITQNDYLSFAKYELNRRYSKNSIFSNPPFVKEVDVLLASDDKSILASFEKEIKYKLEIFTKQYQDQFEMLKFFGPVEYFVSYIKRRHRSKFTIRCDRTKNIQILLIEFQKTIKIPSKTTLRFEVNAR